MANSKSAGKRARQSTVRALRNRSILTRLRKMQKTLRGAAAKPEKKDIHALISSIDKAAKRGTIHKNAAKRRKARLHKLAASSPAAAA